MNFYTNVYSTGSDILIRGIKNGYPFSERVSFSPCLYMNTNKKTDYKSVDGRSLEKICFDTIREMNDFKDQYSNVQNIEFHGDINAEYQYISIEYGEDFEYDYKSLKVMYIDIETTCENGFPEIENPTEQIIAITTMINDTKNVFCLGEFKTSEANVIVCEYEDEKQLLYDFIKHMKNEKPDIITGWNVKFFDIPYLVSRIRFFDDDELSDRELSPWNIIRDRVINKNNKDHKVFDIVGISTLDYYELYKTFTYVNQESYKLDHIAWVELGERKISYSEYDTIADFYKKNFQKFIEYNIKDVELVKRLEDKMKLMELAIALAYSARVNFVDVFSQVRTWDVIIFNHLLKDNIIIPPRKKETKDEQYAGAYVKEPIVGMHKWVVSYDISSMYPSTIMQYNISPETLFAEKTNHINVNDILKPNEEVTKILNICKQNNLSITANGTCYTNNKRGFLAELMDRMYNERKHFKDLMIQAEKDLEAVNSELKKRKLV